MSAVLARTEFNTWTGRLVRRLRRRHNEHCINIITYHSIAKEGDVFTDGTGLRHDPADFERQIEYLAEHFNPVSLRELVGSLERGEAPRRAVVVTFDDGFADTIRRAMPILYRRRIPMTVFAVTSVIGNSDLMWQHKLAWLTANGHGAKVAAALAATETSVAQASSLCFHRQDAGATQSGGPPPPSPNPSLAGRGVSLAATPRRCASLADLARRCYRAELPAVLEDVLRSVGTSGARLAGALRPYLEVEEVAEADPEYVEFGNHTHTHAILSALAADQQRDEIVAARDRLVSLTGQAPIALAYPFGLKRYYNADSGRIARETGHRAALDMRRRINVGRVDPFELSRKPAPCGSQIGFEQMLEDWPVNAATGGNALRVGSRPSNHGSGG